MSSSQRSVSLRVAAVVALIAAIGFGAAHWQSGAIGQDVGPVVKDKPMEHAKQLSQAFRKAAEIAMPTVVTIRSKTKAHPVKRSTSPRGENPFKGTPFEDFFGDDLEGRMQPGGTPRREGMGSGVIIDKSGLILTNNHVVEGADEVTVRLPDGREFKGEDVKVDDQTDLAIVRIKGAGTLPFARLGDSDSLEIGDWVIAVGNPFELEQTVSAGIISGKGRELGAARRAKFLQTDAAINPGNSGGPLLNLDGEVIGINTAIASNTGAFQGIGFAIPSNLAKWIVPQLIKSGSVQRAYLGVAIGEVTQELADKFGLKRGDGVLVSEVYPKTPAADAGFHDGDVITKFGNTRVHNPRELQELVERVPLDSKQQVEVLRNKKTEHLEVVAKALPKEFGASSVRESSSRDEPSKSDNFESQELGLEVANLSAEETDSLGFKGFSGVLISKVDPNGIAAEQGLREGMLVMKVGGKTVHNTTEFQAAVKGESLKEGVLLLVRTRAGNRFVVLQQS